MQMPSLKKCGRLSPAVIIAVVIAITAGNDSDAATGRISVKQSGDPAGETVMLIPGLSTPGEVWEATETALADYDVRTITLTGFDGNPAPEPVSPFIDGAVDAIADYMDEQDLHDVSVVGHSLGGMVTLKLAPASDRVDQVINVDSLPFTAAAFVPGVTPEQAAMQGPAMAQQMAAMPHDSFVQQQQMSAARMTSDPKFADQIIEWSEAADQAAIAAAMGELWATDYRANLAGIDQPITVLAAQSGQDEAAVKALYEGQYSAAPDAIIIMIADTQHFIMHDQPEAFYAALLDALNQGRAQ